MGLASQTVQGRQADIVTDTLVQYNRLVITILGCVSDAVLDRSRDIVDLGTVCELYRTGAVIRCTKDCFTDLMHTRLRQTAEA